MHIRAWWPKPKRAGGRCAGAAAAPAQPIPLRHGFAKGRGKGKYGHARYKFHILADD